MENQPISHSSDISSTNPVLVSQLPIPPQTKTNLMIPILITILVSAAVFGVGGYYLGIRNNSSLGLEQNLKTSDSAQPTTLPTSPIGGSSPQSPTPLPTIVSDKLETSKLTLQHLNFSVPANWWSKKGKNDIYPIEWYDLNPVSPGDPYSTVPIFQLRSDEENTELLTKKDEVIKTWHLVDTKVLNISSGDTKGLSISGTVDPNQDNYNSRFSKNAYVEVVIFKFGQNTYQLLGDVSEPTNKSIFNQIIDTFKFF